MACFLAPTAEAIVTTIVKKVIDKKAQKGAEITDSSKLQNISKKLGWLTKMLWGGAILLCVEHIWHGEVVPWPPFLTAMSSPDSTMDMLKEIATVGVSMAVIVTAVWAVMVLVSELAAKSKKAAAKTAVKEKN